MITWIPVDDSILWRGHVRYQVAIDTPDGPDEWDGEAVDPGDAQTYAAERLLRDYPHLGETTEDVADRIGEALPVHRYA